MIQKKVFITGISKGIGKAIGELLVQSGFEVIGACRNPQKVEDKINGVRYVELDLSNRDSIKHCAQQVGAVDILINNAGQSQIGSIEDVPFEQYRELFEINFLGYIELTSLLIPHMRQQRNGQIINIGSLAGTFPLPFFSAYCASKSAVQTMTLCLRQELRQFGIKVSLVEPNDIKTTIAPQMYFKEGGEYERFAGIVREELRKKMAVADPPEKVARLILKIINSKNPAPKYCIGGNANLLTFAKRLVTDRFLERSTMKMYGL